MLLTNHAIDYFETWNQIDIYVLITSKKDRFDFMSSKIKIIMVLRLKINISSF